MANRYTIPPQRISLMAVRSAIRNVASKSYPLFNYTRLFVRDYGHGWFEQRHRFAFGKDI